MEREYIYPGQIPPAPLLQTVYGAADLFRQPPGHLLFQSVTFPPHISSSVAPFHLLDPVIQPVVHRHRDAVLGRQAADGAGEQF